MKNLSARIDDIGASLQKLVEQLKPAMAPMAMAPAPMAPPMAAPIAPVFPHCGTPRPQRLLPMEISVPSPSFHDMSLKAIVDLVAKRCAKEYIQMKRQNRSEEIRRVDLFQRQLYAAFRTDVDKFRVFGWYEATDIPAAAYDHLFSKCNNAMTVAWRKVTILAS